MATEYLYTALRATAGEEITINAYVTDGDGKAITEGCGLTITDGKTNVIAKVEGTFEGDSWLFTIPADATEGLTGRHFYRVTKGESSLCFPTPIYFVG
jgi:hypothetical protein